MLEAHYTWCIFVMLIYPNGWIKITKLLKQFFVFFSRLCNKKTFSVIKTWIFDVALRFFAVYVKPATEISIFDHGQCKKKKDRKDLCGCLAGECCLYKQHKASTFQLPKSTRSSRPRFYFPTPLPRTSTITSSHFPGKAAPPTNQIWSCAACLGFVQLS